MMPPERKWKSNRPTERPIHHESLIKERRFENAAALTKRRSLQAGVSPQARKIPFQLLKARPRPAGWVAGDFS